jgi:hypothetical protein
LALFRKASRRKLVGEIAAFIDNEVPISGLSVFAQNAADTDFRLVRGIPLAS